MQKDVRGDKEDRNIDSFKKTIITNKLDKISYLKNQIQYWVIPSV